MFLRDAKPGTAPRPALAQSRISPAPYGEAQSRYRCHGGCIKSRRPGRFVGGGRRTASAAPSRGGTASAAPSRGGTASAAATGRGTVSAASETASSGGWGGVASSGGRVGGGRVRRFGAVAPVQIANGDGACESGQNLGFAVAAIALLEAGAEAGLQFRARIGRVGEGGEAFGAGQRTVEPGGDDARRNGGLLVVARGPATASAVRGRASRRRRVGAIEGAALVARGGEAGKVREELGVASVAVATGQTGAGLVVDLLARRDRRIGPERCHAILAHLPAIGRVDAIVEGLVFVGAWIGKGGGGGRCRTGRWHVAHNVAFGQARDVGGDLIDARPALALRKANACAIDEVDASRDGLWPELDHAPGAPVFEGSVAEA